jgi:hypothetical protein
MLISTYDMAYGVHMFSKPMARIMAIDHHVNFTTKNN